jgi:MFS family permease
MSKSMSSNWNATSLSVATIFMVLSLLFGSWLARLPEVQLSLGLGESALGFALLGLPIGAFMGTQFSNWLIPKIGTGVSTFYSSLLFCCSMLLPAFVADGISLFISLILIGSVNGWMNVSMNAAAANLEKNWNISIMSSCHGMFSLGAMIGAGISGLLATKGVGFVEQQYFLVSAMVIVLLISFSHLKKVPNGASEKQKFQWPDKAVWLYVIIGFFVMMGEGAIADWSAIMLKNELNANLFLASMGFAGFSLAMAIGRFSGDHLRTQFSGLKMVIIGCFIGSLGLLLAASNWTIYISILGFFVAGIGLSIVVPLLFVLAAQQSKQSEVGISAVATSGIIGYLISPPIIGLVGEHFGLPLSFLGIAIVIGVAGFLGLLTQKAYAFTFLAKRKI